MEDGEFANRIETVVREGQGVASPLRDDATFRVAVSHCLVEKSADGFKSADKEIWN